MYNTQSTIAELVAFDYRSFDGIRACYGLVNLLTKDLIMRYGCGKSK